MTRAKKRQLNDDFATSSTENKPTHITKRPNEVNSSKITQTKKQKISEKTGMPATKVINENHDSEINISTNKTVAVLAFSVNEIVWGKIRGWPHWPARVTSIEGRKFEVVWFNDYRKSKLFRTQLFKFCDNFEQFAQKFPTTIGLETAAKEALLLMAAARR